MRAYLSPEEVAERLEVDVRDVEKSIVDGTLRALKVGESYRIHEREFRRWSTPPSRLPRPGLVFAMLAALALCVNTGILVAFELGANESSRVTNGVPRVLPFEGSYTLDGQPVNSNTPMSFSLYEQGIGGAPIWSSSNRSVDVSDGRFAVALGDANDATPIPEDAFASSSLFLEIIAEGSALSPRQRIAPAPQALAAARAVHDFDVPGSLGVSDSLSVGPSSISAATGHASLSSLHVDDATVAGTLSVSSNGEELSLNGVYCGSTPQTNGKFLYPLGAVAPLAEGYRAAKRLCEDACGTTTAYMCSPGDMVKSAQIGVLPTVANWYATFSLDLFESGATNSQFTRDCEGWTTDAITTGNRANFGPTFGFDANSTAFPNRNECNTLQPIACCD